MVLDGVKIESSAQKTKILSCFIIERSKIMFYTF